MSYVPEIKLASYSNWLILSFLSAPDPVKLVLDTKSANTLSYSEVASSSDEVASIALVAEVP